MSDKPKELVLLRHGHSEWNITNRFTGWSNIELTETGLNEAEKCGRLLAELGYQFDEVHLSMLKRAEQTAKRLLQAAQHEAVPLHQHWRLNERHYGSLQGMNKTEIFEQWGEQQSRKWWRGYHESPPALDLDDPRHPRFEPIYIKIDPGLLPNTESLEQCQLRTLPYWEEEIIQRIKSGRRLLIISHGNTMRAIRMHVEKISVEAIEKVEIPSAKPLVYRFNTEMELVETEWLEQPETLNHSSSS